MSHARTARPADALRDEEVAAEQRYVEQVYARLAQLRHDVAETERAGYRQARVGNHSALVERDAMVFHAARRRHALDAEYEGLVFGRLDLGPQPGRTPTPTAATPAIPGGEARYVGRLGLRDAQHDSLVVDWRAPAAAPFYRATPTERMGVVRRRMIRSAGEQVIDVEDDLLDPDAAPESLPVIGDGALMATLARATGRGMRDIVATIQREQDEAIRSPATGVTLVRGGPGTGKTAVALHRAAYLLYSDRNRFESGGVLVVGPSEVFVDYVSRVLPSLGEDTVTLRALGHLAAGVSSERHDPAPAAAAKGTLRMVRLLGRAARDAAPDGPDRLRLLYRGQLLSLDRNALDAARRGVLSGGGRRNTSRPRAAGWLLDALWRQSQELLSAHYKRSRAEFATEIAERREFVQFMHAWWPPLRPLDVLGWLADRRRLSRYAQGLLSPAEVETVAASLRDLAEIGPSVADIALLDELHELLGEIPVKTRPKPADNYRVLGMRPGEQREPVERGEDYREYAHIVVDEAQDVSPMQWRMVGRRAEYASWTIVGDPAQAAWPDPREATEAMNAAVSGRRRHEYTLRTNYRNAAEIFALAAEVIRAAEPDIELPTAVRPGGAAPVVRLVPAAELPAAARDAALAMLDEVPGTVGVITPMARQSEVAGWLAEVPRERLQVVGSLEAKGMEYDGVVVVEPSGIRDESSSGVRTLYVALSRATQRLVTVGTDDAWRPQSP